MIDEHHRRSFPGVWIEDEVGRGRWEQRGTDVSGCVDGAVQEGEVVEFFGGEAGDGGVHAVLEVEHYGGNVCGRVSSRMAMVIGSSLWYVGDIVRRSSGVSSGAARLRGEG